MITCKCPRKPGRNWRVTVHILDYTHMRQVKLESSRSMHKTRINWTTMPHNPVNPSPDLPILAAYSLRWEGRILIIHPERWHGPFLDVPDTDEDRMTLVSMIREQRPQSLVINLRGVDILPAFRTGLLVRLVKELDGIKRPGRCFIAEAAPAIIEYLKVAHLTQIFIMITTETDAIKLAASIAHA